MVNGKTKPLVCSSWYKFQHAAYVTASAKQLTADADVVSYKTCKMGQSAHHSVHDWSRGQSIKQYPYRESQGRELRTEKTLQKNLSPGDYL